MMWFTLGLQQPNRIVYKYAENDLSRAKLYLRVRKSGVWEVLYNMPRIKVCSLKTKNIYTAQAKALLFLDSE